MAAELRCEWSLGHCVRWRTGLPSLFTSMCRNDWQSKNKTSNLAMERQRAGLLQPSNTIILPARWQELQSRRDQNDRPLFNILVTRSALQAHLWWPGRNRRCVTKHNGAMSFSSSGGIEYKEGRAWRRKRELGRSSNIPSPPASLEMACFHLLNYIQNRGKSAFIFLMTKIGLSWIMYGELLPPCNGLDLSAEIRVQWHGGLLFCNHPWNAIVRKAEYV